MSDNSLVPVASGNETFANDDIGGVKYPRPKINWGPDGTANDVDVASGKALPIQVRSATGLIPLGEPTDAANTATDTTSVSGISVWKQISASVQAMATALAGAITVATHAVTQSGTWTVQPGNTANTTAWKVDASSVAVPVTDNAGSLTVDNPALSAFGAGGYETVAASSSDQALGATGAAGDYLSGLLVVPATTSPGSVSIKDGGGSAITVFTGGATSVSNLVPFFIPLGLISTSGAWKVTTGANVSVIGCGKFT